VVGLNQAFTLSVEISGSQQLDANPVLPELSEFAHFLNSSTSSQMNIVNNRMSVTYTVQYRFQAITEGTFAIPSFEVATGGQQYSTEPLTHRVPMRAASQLRIFSSKPRPARHPCSLASR
jgi:hypothetical protein